MASNHTNGDGDSDDDVEIIDDIRLESSVRNKNNRINKRNTKKIHLLEDDEQIVVTFEKLSKINVNDEPEVIVLENNETENVCQFLCVKSNDYEPNDTVNGIEYLFQILNPTEIVDLMHRKLRDLTQITNLSLTAVRIIMSKYEWPNTEEFFNLIIDKGLDQLINQCKIIVNDTKNVPKMRTAEEKDSKEETCIICFDNIRMSQLYGSTCGHLCCFECWNGYLINDIKESTDKVMCPNDGCDHLIDDRAVIKLINDKVIKDKYRRLITNSFVSHDSRLRWCPNNSCLHAIRMQYSYFEDIQCVCKATFCFLCGEERHEPLPCDIFKDWLKKFASESIDSNSALYLKDNTKSCPKCGHAIEKNGGCNYVQCAKCKYTFCFDCLGKCYHGQCMGMVQSDGIAARGVSDKKRQEIMRNANCYENYQSQLKLQRIELNLQNEFFKIIQSFQNDDKFKKVLKCLITACGVLCYCRSTIMHSYVFNFFALNPQEMIEIHIKNVKELETATKELYDLIIKVRDDSSIGNKFGFINFLTNIRRTFMAQNQSYDVNDVKMHIKSKYQKCDDLRIKLVKYVRVGFSQKVWQFNKQI